MIITLETIVARHIDEARIHDMTGKEYIAWLGFKDKIEGKIEFDLELTYKGLGK